MSRAETERPRLDRLLAASGIEFTEEPLDRPASRGRLAIPLAAAAVTSALAGEE